MALRPPRYDLVARNNFGGPPLEQAYSAISMRAGLEREGRALMVLRTGLAGT